MYILVTEVDALTKVVCTSAPQSTGPSMPAVKGLKITWADESTWPVETDATGVYLRAPKYYGTCDDDAGTNVAGVLRVLTETEYSEARVAEHEARKPYPSWIGDLNSMTWSPPVPMPDDCKLHSHDDGKMYRWDEDTTSWVEVTQ